MRRSLSLPLRLSPASRRQLRRSPRRPVRTRAVSAPRQEPLYLDYYSLLKVDPGASQAQVKDAYRGLQKICHPDYMGPTGHNMSSLLNYAYFVLRDPGRRASFDRERLLQDEMKEFTNMAYSKWAGPPEEQRAHFVDEQTCIGCLKCALWAEGTFGIDLNTGCARVVTQWGDTEADIDIAVGSCPVSCIHEVDRDALPTLEFVMRKQLEKGSARKENPFAAASAFTKKISEQAVKNNIVRVETPFNSHKQTHASSDAHTTEIQTARYEKPHLSTYSEAQLLPEPHVDDLAYLREVAELWAMGEQPMIVQQQAEVYWKPSHIDEDLNGSANEGNPVDDFVRVESDAKYYSTAEASATPASPEEELGASFGSPDVEPQAVHAEQHRASFDVTAVVPAALMLLLLVSGVSHYNAEYQITASDKREYLLQKEQQQHRCYESGGGLCRFFL